MKNIKALQIACVVAVVGTGVVVGSVFGVKYKNNKTNEDLPSTVEYEIEEENDIDDDRHESDEENFVSPNEPDNEQEENLDDEEKTDLPDVDSPETIDNEKVAEFLDNFAEVYFSENEPFDVNEPDEYEIVRFCFCHERNYNNENIVAAKINSKKMLGISVKAVDELSEKYFGLSSILRSDKTGMTKNEKFIYSDGCFYTYAASGLPRMNQTSVNSVTVDGDEIIVEFSIYTCENGENATEGDKYSDGIATLCRNVNTFSIKKYEVK